jgi:hypothetical protein
MDIGQRDIRTKAAKMKDQYSSRQQINNEEGEKLMADSIFKDRTTLRDKKTMLMEQRKQVAAIINLQNKKYERGQEMVEREF